MSRPKLHKLYFPGLISLVFLPLLCIGYLFFEGKFEQHSKLDIAWNDASSLKRWQKSYHRAFSFSSFRNFDNSILTGDTIPDKLVLANFSSNLKKLESKTDTINGYSVTFSNKSKYDDIVELINTCYKPSINGINWILYDDKIYLYRFTPAKGPDSYNTLDNDEIYPPLTGYQQFMMRLSKFKNAFFSDLKSLTSFWPSLIVLIIMIVLTCFKKTTYNPTES
jgi:hypothetical protein